MVVDSKALVVDLVGMDLVGLEVDCLVRLVAAAAGTYVADNTPAAVATVDNSGNLEVEEGIHHTRRDIPPDQEDRFLVVPLVPLASDLEPNLELHRLLRLFGELLRLLRNPWQEMVPVPKDR